MKKRFTLILFCLIPAFFSWSVSRPKAVFIIIDGVPADVVEKTPTPAIDEIASSGGYTRAHVGGEKGTYSESPTISAPGYNHLLTGTWSDKHNVWDNSIDQPDYHYWNIFRIAKYSDPELKTAIFSTWLDNRTKLVGEGLLQAGNIKLDYAFDGFEYDTARFPHSDPDFIFKIDELVSTEAARYVLEKGPDLSWVYLEFTDDTGHRYGDSPQMVNAVENTDIQIGRIWNAVKERMAKTGEEWMIVVTTDHGRKPQNGKDHGGQSERERTTWIATNIKDLNSHFGQNSGIVDIMPSILRFMNISIPDPIREELDGVPFYGKISISDLKATRLDNDKVRITWNVIDPGGKADIYITNTNNFSEGTPDHYIKAGTTDVADGMYIADNEIIKSGFLKILVKAPDNWLNTWIKK
jgi:hypothetical protein